jgi:integrase
MSVKVRYRKIKEGEYSIYLDRHVKGEKRKTETLEGKVSNNYCKKPRPTFANANDKRLVEEAEQKAHKKNKELSLNDALEHLNVDPLDEDKELFEYIEEKQEECYNTRAKAYERLKVNLKKFQTSSISVGEIDLKWLKKFKVYLVANLKGTTVDTYLYIMKILLDEAVEDKIILISPFPKKGFFLKVRSEKKSIKDYLTFEEVQLLHENPLDSIACTAFLFCCFSGIRLSDVERLRWDHIINGEIHIVQYKTRDQSFEENNIPLHIDALRILDSLERDSDKVFDLPNRSEISTTLKLWANVIGLK